MKIEKVAKLKSTKATEEEMTLINKFALEPLKAEEVFLFKMVLCDNEVDRAFEKFSMKALENMVDLYKGKTIIKDHEWTADNQVARIYDTYVEVDETKANEVGEPYACLVAKCYTVLTEENKGLISEIKGGLKKEVSVGFATTELNCSICGKNNAEHYCKHLGGQMYQGKTCYFEFGNVSDAFEVSFVAVPCQKGAGVTKAHDSNFIREKNVERQLEDVEAFIFLEKLKES